MRANLNLKSEAPKVPSAVALDGCVAACQFLSQATDEAAGGLLPEAASPKITIITLQLQRERSRSYVNIR
jgi:hypothetical protein